VSSSRHLIVDGANVLCAWSDFRALAKRDRQSARSKLWQLLVPIHDDGEARVTVVFDGRGEEVVVERPLVQTTFSIVYTPASLTADDVIEQMVANSAHPSECCVVTDDTAERETVSALGATTLRCADLAEWVKRADLRQAAKVQELRAANTRAWKKP
jgi:predicted RNA-binding protein with PIN domain